MMGLEKQVLLFLKGLPRTFFFKSSSKQGGLVGAVKGKLTFFLVLENDRKISISEIKFSEKVRRCGGDHFVARSLEDVCEIAKIRGWHD